MVIDEKQAVLLYPFESNTCLPEERLAAMLSVVDIWPIAAKKRYLRNESIRTLNEKTGNTLRCVMV